VVSLCSISVTLCSLGFRRFHFTWAHLNSLGLTWVLLVSFGFTWFRLVSLGATSLKLLHFVTLGFGWSNFILTREKGRAAGARRAKGKESGCRLKSILTYIQSVHSDERNATNRFPDDSRSPQPLYTDAQLLAKLASKIGSQIFCIRSRWRVPGCSLVAGETLWK